MKEEKMTTLAYDEVIKKTAKAALIRFEIDEVWLPLSRIKINIDGTVDVPEWLVERNDLEYYEV